MFGTCNEFAVSNGIFFSDALISFILMFAVWVIVVDLGVAVPAFLGLKPKIIIRWIFNIVGTSSVLEI